MTLEIPLPKAPAIARLPAWRGGARWRAGPRRPGGARLLFAAAALLPALASAPAQAQGGVASSLEAPAPPANDLVRPFPPEWPGLTRSERVEHMLINGALAGVGSGLFAALQKRNPIRPALMGFGGGVLAGAGRQLSTRSFDAAGIVGRQVSALGISLVRAAAYDTAIIMLPAGPFTIDLHPAGDERRVSARLNLMHTGVLAYYLARSDRDFDLSATLWSGVPVFRHPDATFSSESGRSYGRMDFGAIMLGADVDRDGPAQFYVLRHEMIHVLQMDFSDQLLFLPAERALLRRAFPRFGFLRYVDIGALPPLVTGGLNRNIEYDRRPWEREAVWLTEGRGHSHSDGDWHLRTSLSVGATQR